MIRLRELIGCITLTTLPLPAQAQDNDGPPESDWRVSAVMGVAGTPTYPGDDDLLLAAFPDLRVEYKNRFFASITGIGYNVLKTDNWRAGPIMRFDFGRDELEGNPLSLSGDETDELIGLGNIDFSPEVGAFVAFETGAWSSKLEVRQGLDGGHEGIVSNLELKHSGQASIFGRPSFFSIGPEFIYADDQFQQTYFGITANQAELSGLTPYILEAGVVSYGLHGNLFVPLNDKWTIGGFAGVNQLGDEAADSPLVIERGDDVQPLVGMFLSYTF